MILKSNKQTEIISEGDKLETTKMTISINDIGFIQHTMSNLYEDAIGSTVREVTSNGWDSHTGANEKSPIIVSLYQDSQQWFVSFEDVGLGINQKLVDEVISQYGKSTKKGSNDFLGCYGLN